MLGRAVTEKRKSDAPVTVDAANSDRFLSRVRELIGDESVRKFAQRAGIPPSTLQHVLDGGRPNVDKLVAIARAGGVTVDWLATGEGPRTIAEVHATHALHEGNAPAPQASPHAFDEFLMLNTIVEIEDMLDVELGEKKNNLDIYWKAKLIVYVYKRYIESRSSGKRFTGADIVRLIRATPDASSDS
jgi:transcriptional regulator with XRE-family HTH domain